MIRAAAVLCILLSLQACDSRTSASMSPVEANQIQLECRSGAATGQQCERADRAAAKAEHDSAQSAFRNMSGAN